MSRRASIPLQANRPDIDSFYHLSGCDLTGKACQGTACFVARHLNPQRWKQATTQEPRVYCLGQCFVAPSILIMTMAARDRAWRFIRGKALC